MLWVPRSGACSDTPGASSGGSSEYTRLFNPTGPGVTLSSSCSENLPEPSSRLNEGRSWRQARTNGSARKVERCVQNDTHDHCGAGDARRPRRDAGARGIQRTNTKCHARRPMFRARPGPWCALKVALQRLARYQGDKEDQASAPYTLWVTANDCQTNELANGVEMPIASGPAVNYRNVGTSIDCNASAGPGPTYKLALTVNDFVCDSGRARQSPFPDAQPSFRSFHSAFDILLRDGQSAQYTTATDPVSGEVTKIDIALTVPEVK